jgi:phosphatidylserine/phosphatidylglycerophosphate/cardiolipin synthase-like enzyme
VIARLALAALFVVALATPGAVAFQSPASDAPDGDADVPTTGTPASPAVAAVYPDPVADGDRGEYVLLAFPDPTSLGNWTLSDGETTVNLGNATISGRLAVTASPNATRNLTDARVLARHDAPALANGGERVVLRRNGTVVDALRYPDAEEAARYDGETWTPLGATDHDVETTRVDDARAFVLPDAPGVPMDVLASADDRLLLAGYTLTSERVVAELVAAHERGVDVRVLLDAGPVGGISTRQARLLDRLVAAGIAVRVHGGPRARYDFHHAKYAVADDRAVVLTENWKPAGTGGHGSRGWGVALDDPAFATDLAAVFASDFDAHDAVTWRRYRQGETFEPATPTTATYPSAFDPATVPVDRVELLVAPDNAEGRLLELLRSAENRVRVQQVAIGGPDDPFLRAAIAAARRGVDVDVLLSGAWYVREDNRALVDRLNSLAEREGLPLDAAVVDPDGRFEKVHAKGVVVDDSVVVGSLNWNTHAARENREVLVVLHGDEAADYYARVVASDRRGRDGGPAPRGTTWVVGLAAVAAVAAAVLVARRVAFVDETEPAESGDAWP